MPEEHSCIVCGRPSETRVCMHCFFQYDHRTYNSREREKRALDELDPLHEFMKHSFAASESSFEPSSQPDYHHSIEEPVEPANDTERHSLVSWFSRMSR